MKKSYSISHLLSLIPGGELLHCEDPSVVEIENVASLEKNKKNAVSFVGKKVLASLAEKSDAKLLVVSEEIKDLFQRPIIAVKDPSFAMIPIMELFHPPKTSSGKVSEKAHIDSSAKIGENTQIDAFVTVGKNCVIGDNCMIAHGAYLGEGVTLGSGVRIGPNDVIHDGVTIGERFLSHGNSTIGADGFRFTFDKGAHHKIPQTGSVVIGDDVEIGANCTIDRGGIEDTIIGNGVKFDNMVHIAHNCVLKDHIVIAAQSGMAGSTTVGNYVMLSGHVALQDHIEIADGVMVGGKTAIRKSIKEKGIYNGEYALPLSDYKSLRKNLRHLIHFGKWSERVKTLEEKIESLLPTAKAPKREPEKERPHI